MTKTKNKHSRASSRQGITARNHSWILVLIIIFIIVAVVTVAVLVTKPHSDATPDSSQPTPSVSDDDTSNPDSGSPVEPSTTTPEAPENKAPQFEGEDPNQLEELTGVISSKSVENGVLTIMTTINQYLHQTGICVITLTGRTQHNVYTASSDAHADVSVSYCENFDIPVSELASDTYDIEIKLTGDGKTGTIHDEVTL